MTQILPDRDRPGSTPFDRLFRDHPREVGESYLEHFAASAGFGFRLLGLAGAAFAHALTAGKAVQEYEPEGRAAEEVSQLYAWICKQIGMSDEQTKHQAKPRRRTA